MNSCNQKCRNHVQSKIALTLLQLLMNNHVQFVCLWCCVPLDFVVQINNFFSLVLFSAVIHKRRGKKLISKTIKYKLYSSSKMQFAFFYPKDIHKVFWKTISFVENLEMVQIAGGRGHILCIIVTQCVQKLTFDSPLTEK